jgi:hypothetical protein
MTDITIIGHARAVIALFGALLVGACGGGTTTPAATTSTASVATTAPSATTDAASTATPSGPLTADELVWLQGIGTLQKRMEKVFEQMPSNMTSASTRATAEKLRACTPELAKLGAATARLQPVNRLGQQGCAKFAEAATHLVKTSNSNNANKIKEELDLASQAFSQGDALLANAQMKGFEIQTANQ